MFDALFQALFSYRPVVFQQGEFRFDLTGASFLAADPQGDHDRHAHDLTAAGAARPRIICPVIHVTGFGSPVSRAS